ncbi:MAG TPA: type II toxin-antitoxin system HicA family toxin [Candidatus Nanoarchaeia archaeon]|nr:type II toxin-antitoxin system HicA family toxin [Candidatus Nanoarchaeia archaeon]
MKPQSVNKVCKALKELGFEFVRQKGSHLRFAHPDGRKTTVPSHSGEDIGPKLLNKIAKDIGVEKEEFERALSQY